MTGAFPFPLGGLAPREVPLSRSPLVRVIAQARFGSVLKIDSKDGVVPFQEAVRSEYPLLEQAAVQQLQVDFSSGAPNFRPMTGKSCGASAMPLKIGYFPYHQKQLPSKPVATPFAEISWSAGIRR